MKKLLIVVDYQNDFVTGSLGFKGAEALEEPIAGKIEEYRKMGTAGQIILRWILTTAIIWTRRRADTCPWNTALTARTDGSFTAR